MMNRSNKLVKILCVVLLTVLVSLCGMNVFADEQPAATAANQVDLAEAAEQAQQQAIQQVLEPAGMMPIFLWSMLAGLIMCIPVVILLIIKRRNQKY